MTGRTGPGRHGPRRRLALATAVAVVASLGTGCSSGARRAVPPTSAPVTTPAPTGSSTSSTPPPTAGTIAGTTTTTAACSDQAVIRSWPLRRLAAQLVIVPVLDGDPASVRAAVSAQAGGVLLLGSVPPGPQLVAALGPAINPPAQPGPLVMADQEGGGVQRLGADVTSIPWARQMAATMTPAQVRQLAETLGRQMAALGVGVDLAPVLDLDSGPLLSSTDADGPRSFSIDPSVAAAYGAAFAAGLQAGGVLAVVKHFPGLGGASANTDYGPASTRPISDLERAGLVPFERLIAGGVRAVMVANATVPGLTSRPASVSPSVITGLLRDRLHFGGLVMTDSLSAGALLAAGYTLPAAAAAAVEAGADMVMFGSTLTPAQTASLRPAPLVSQIQAVVGAIVDAVGTGALPQARLDQAVLHVVEAKGADLCRAPGG